MHLPIGQRKVFGTVFARASVADAAALALKSIARTSYVLASDVVCAWNAYPVPDPCPGSPTRGTAIAPFGPTAPCRSCACLATWRVWCNEYLEKTWLLQNPWISIFTCWRGAAFDTRHNEWISFGVWPCIGIFYVTPWIGIFTERPELASIRLSTFFSWKISLHTSVIVEWRIIHF